MKKKLFTQALSVLLAGVIAVTPMTASAAEGTTKEVLPSAQAEEATKHKLTVKYYFESLSKTDIEKDGVYYEELVAYPATETEVEDNFWYIPQLLNVSGFTIDESFVDSIQKITKDTEIIQYYTRNSYNLTLDKASGDIGIKETEYSILPANAYTVSGNDVSVKYGATVTLVAETNANYFQVDKWVDFKKNTLSTSSIYSFKMPAENVTAYATTKLANGYAYYTKEWYKETDSTEIGKSSYTEYKIEKAVGKIGDNVTIAADPSISTTDYELNEKVVATVKTAKLNASGTELKLYYDKKHIALKYELNGATNDSRNPDYFKKNSKQYIYPVAKTGYTFDGWYYDKAFTNKLKTSGTTQYFESSASAPVTIYAKFTTKQVTDPNKGEQNKEETKNQTELEKISKGREITAITASYKQDGAIVGSLLDTTLIDVTISYKDGSSDTVPYTQVCSETLTDAIKEGANVFTFKVDNYSVELSVTGYIGNNNVEVINGREFTAGSDIYTIKSTSKKEVAYTYNASKKTTVNIPSYIMLGNQKYKVTTISASCFKNNKKVKKVTVPDTVTTIGKNAFYKCTALTTVTIGTGCKKIDKQAFYGCKKLKTINVKSKKVTSVGKNAFKGIYAKAKFNVPKKKSVYNKYKKLFAKGQAKTCKYVKKY